MQKTISILLTLLFLGISIPAWGQKSMHVAFINPDPKGSSFWDQTTAFMKVVAAQLNIRLSVYYGDRGRFMLRDNVHAALAQPDRPDFLVTIFQREMAVSLLETVQRSGVKLFVINTEAAVADIPRIGKPREKYSSWVGHLFPDDEKGGYDLMKKMAESVPDHQEDKNLPHKMIGITGSRESTPGILRKKGCMTALEEAGHIRLEQMVYAYWDRQKASAVTNGLLKRYADISLIWCAGGVMTQGILDALNQREIIPGKDMLIGTFDWSKEVIGRVKKGEILASAGGHFLEGGWALILLYDYHNGIDFKDRLGVSIRDSLTIMDKGNAARFEAMVLGKYWETIDFRQLTRTHRGKGASYHLDIESLINDSDHHASDS